MSGAVIRDVFTSQLKRAVATQPTVRPLVERR
jgi:hypothetical protein